MSRRRNTKRKRANDVFEVDINDILNNEPFVASIGRVSADGRRVRNEVVSLPISNEVVSLPRKQARLDPPNVLAASSNGFDFTFCMNEDSWKFEGNEKTKARRYASSDDPLKEWVPVAEGAGRRGAVPVQVSRLLPLHPFVFRLLYQKAC
ncbi:hypothetical protein PC9H_002330 [Pleurotus ostreatus]|uniref:Uncharacterized protein n=1 Tax=Pleurotus ostreatus TaxID=5322 RepID=A0A8H7DN80_PLEOS|nr:uncharacterized protein PC9H_002330 [Pleurotus ostreatus]KAF7416070.1 hypothetical protein PC9H_002330 [Pleurotus ostreatus]